MRKDPQNHEYNIEPLVALSNAMRLLQRCRWFFSNISWYDSFIYYYSGLLLPPYLLNHRYEFKNNHGEWVKSVKPHLGPGIAERVWEAINAKDDNIDACLLVKTELQAALRGLLEVVPSLLEIIKLVIYIFSSPCNPSVGVNYILFVKIYSYFTRVSTVLHWFHPFIN